MIHPTEKDIGRAVAWIHPSYGDFVQFGKITSIEHDIHGNLKIYFRRGNGIGWDRPELFEWAD